MNRRTLEAAATPVDLEIPEIFGLDARRQSWLDVEAALATAEAAVGLVPDDAAEVIRSHARLSLLDTVRLEREAMRTGHDLAPLLDELARVCGPDAGGWVHWGATSRNIALTGDLLLARRAHRVIVRRLADLLRALGRLAEREAETPMAGRTHGQHALPITFGFKVAAWIHEFDVHATRLAQAEATTFLAMLGGAVGTSASFGVAAAPLQDGFARELDMPAMSLPARSTLDHLAHYVCLLALLGATCGKVAREISSLMSTEIGEVAEPAPPGVIGSSTMPQKRNPHRSQDVVATAALLRSLVAPALEAAEVEHEGDRARNLVMQDCLQRACVAAGEAIGGLATIAGGLVVDRDRMARGLGLTDGLICAEAVMLALGRSVGRGPAHQIVAAAAIDPGEGTSFAHRLKADPRVTQHLAEDAIDSLIRPEAYLGRAAELAKLAAVRAAASADRLAVGLSGRQGPAHEFEDANSETNPVKTRQE